MKYAEEGFLLAIMKQCFELKQQCLCVCIYVHVHVCVKATFARSRLFNRILSLVKNNKK